MTKVNTQLLEAKEEDRKREKHKLEENMSPTGGTCIEGRKGILESCRNSMRKA